MEMEDSDFVMAFRVQEKLKAAPTCKSAEPILRDGSCFSLDIDDITVHSVDQVSVLPINAG